MPPKNYTILTEKIKRGEQWKVRYGGYLLISGWDSRLSRRLIFPYLLKTNGMLWTAKSFCFFAIKAWPLPPKNLINLTQKIKRGEQWKVRCAG